MPHSFVFLFSLWIGGRNDGKKKKCKVNPCVLPPPGAVTEKYSVCSVTLSADIVRKVSEHIGNRCGVQVLVDCSKANPLMCESRSCKEQLEITLMYSSTFTDGNLLAPLLYGKTLRGLLCGWILLCLLQTWPIARWFIHHDCTGINTSDWSNRNNLLIWLQNWWHCLCKLLFRTFVN